MATFEDTLRALRHEFKNRFILRWTVANMIGWSVGLFSATLIAQLSSSLLGNTIGGISGLLLAGAIIGLSVGYAQFKVITIHPRWVQYSAIGGIVSAIPVFLMYVMLIFGKLGFFLIGAIFGMCFGWVQSLTLKDQAPDSLSASFIWITANTFAGGLCSVLSLTGTPFALPIFCSLGPVAFGLITGYALLKLLHEHDL